MQATIAIDDELLRRAETMVGPKPLSELVRDALQALIEREAALLLIELGGSDPDAEAPPRDRAEPS